MFAWITYDNRNRLHLFPSHQTAHADLAAVRDRKGGALRVGAFRGVGATIVAPLLKRLASGRPDLRIELTQTTSDTELFVLFVDRWRELNVDSSGL